MPYNKTLHDLGIASLEAVRDQLTTMIITPGIGPEDVGAATVTFKLSRTAGRTMLISASGSNPGYEELDFSREARELLASVDRLLAVASAFAKTADD